MLAKLAFGNMRKSIRDYTIYFVSLALGVAVFYTFNTISDQATFLDQDVSNLLKTVAMIMRFVTYMLACIMGFLMVYANNFLIRRRKKEIGLYQILGMRRCQVAFIFLIELSLTSLVSFACGISLGALLSQLLVFVTALFFQMRVVDFHFFFSGDAFFLTAICFTLIFLAMMALTVLSVGKTRLIELMSAHRTNETVHMRNPFVAFLFILIGGAIIGWSYVRLLHDGLPLYEEEYRAFFITTALVMLGTFLFFFGLGGFIFAIAKRLKWYWSDIHMFTIRQFASKITSNSISSAVIALVLFLAITSVTAGISFINAINSADKLTNSFDASIIKTSFYHAGTQQPPLSSKLSFKQEIEKDNDFLKTYPASVEACTISLASGGSQEDENDNLAYADIFFLKMAKASDASYDAFKKLPMKRVDDFPLEIMPESSYQAICKFYGKKPIDITEDSYLISAAENIGLSQVFSEALKAQYSISLAGQTLKPASDLLIDDETAAYRNGGGMSVNTGTIIISDDLFDRVCIQFPDIIKTSFVNYNYSKDVDPKQADVLFLKLQDDFNSGRALQASGSSSHEQGSAVMTEMFDSITRYGNTVASSQTTAMVSYMAVYIGFVLVVSCGAIIAIQQISQANEAAPLYYTLYEIGCPRKSLFKSLFSQIFLSFAMPCVVGLAHSAVAMIAVLRILELLGYFNLAKSSVFIALIFCACYGAYLFISYHMARSIIHTKLVTGRKSL